MVCDVLEKQGLCRKGLKEKRAKTWQLRAGHVVKAVLHLKADGERSNEGGA